MPVTIAIVIENGLPPFVGLAIAVVVQSVAHFHERKIAR